MKAITKNLWAPIATPKRGHPWVIWTSVASTRSEARKLYLKNFIPQYHKEVLKRVRFARVTIVEQVAGDAAAFCSGSLPLFTNSNNIEV
jgi:hypothetical protein